MAGTEPVQYVIDSIRHYVLHTLFEHPAGVQNTALTDAACRLGQSYGVVASTVHDMLVDGEIETIPMAYTMRNVDRAYTDTYGYVLSAASWLRLARKEQDAT